MSFKVIHYSSFINKLFQRPSESAEFEFAKILDNKNNSLVKKSLFYKLRTGKVDWTDDLVVKLPCFHTWPLKYWTVPWADKKRTNTGFFDRFLKGLNFKSTCLKFEELLSRIETQGFDNSNSPIKGYLLQQGDKEVFQYTDGNRRLGILAYLYSMGRLDINAIKIHVEIKKTFNFDTVDENNEIQDICSRNNIGKEDLELWIAHAFR